ncbi:putative glycine--tRNA ligase [Penaeus vannamei]|uniref:Putative glycine--tRNA ligase n=2 Tax=Penaeus vannamei TaxID=6689 RepID=A0A3R7Q420_PENVA|nr:putative glycine--tRNA ligase [Penaeus vannamei]
MVANETLGYYMARIYQYLLKIGINPKKLRFRQHLSNEMAHYACDCWDAECLTSYGWIECVGCADRSAYDLGQHTKASGVRLSVERPLKEPRIVDAVAAVPDKGIIGKTFKKDAKAVQEALASLSNEVAEKMDKALSEAGEYELNGFKLTRAMVPSFKREQKKVHVEEYIPSVVEPSFGVGRVLYSLLEHSFRVREDDDKRTYFSLPPIVAPVKVSVLPLSNKPEFIPFTVQLSNDLTELNISSRIDDSTGSIGRRYARTDEIAIPFGVTIDFDTCNNTPNTVTLRERDSTEQVRMPGMVANETLGYYMARIYQYLLKIGINPKKLRFRQHLSNEMAHYACDCWDAECLTSYGWIECVGCADRSAYDLGQHTKASGVRLSVERPLKEPRIVDAVAAVPDKGIIGKTFKKDAKAVQEALASLSNEVAEKMDKALSEAGEYELNGFKLTRAMVPSFKREQKKVHVEEYIPSVVEPSFGVGRVLYSLLEHSFRVREDDDKRTYFSLPPIVAPVKVSVLPLSNKPEFIPFTVQLSNDLTELNISSRIDDSTGSIGRRYARTDEIAIPFGVTIDFDTCNNTPNTVTLRERDSTEQVRMPIEEVAPTVRLLADGKMEWKQVTDKWPKFVAQETTK